MNQRMKPLNGFSAEQWKKMRYDWIDVMGTAIRMLFVSFFVFQFIRIWLVSMQWIKADDSLFMLF